MFSRIIFTGAIACAVLSPLGSFQVMATDRTFDGGAAGTGTDYYTPANWSNDAFPTGQFHAKGVIGTTGAGQPTGFGLLTATATASTTPDMVTGAGLRQSGGLTLGREPTSEGTLNIVTGGTARFTYTANAATAGTNGAVYLGSHLLSSITPGGIGHLNISGNGTLIGTGLFVEGETVGANRSSVSLSDSATVTLGPVTNVFTSTLFDIGVDNLRFARDLTITGPSVNFTNTGNLEIQSTNAYTANITSATAHSAMKTTGNAALGGTLTINFSGLVSNPAVNQTWNLIDYGGNLFGSFSNAAINQEITVNGLPQPVALGATFKLRRANGGANGKLIQLIQQGLVVLQVNRDTGEMKLTNPHGADIDIDAYRIGSELGSLLPTYKGISGAPAGDSGWEKPPTNSTTGLAELKSMPFTTFDLQANPSVTLGTGAGKGFDKFAVAADVANFGTDGEDLQFTYSTPDGPVTGHIQYIGTKFENNLVLRVNPNSGQAYLKNDSLETLTFDGYSIESSTGSLDSASWSGLGSGWLKTDLEPDALSETNLLASITLEPEDEVPIGDIGAFATTAAQDGLSMKFILAVGLGGSGPLVGDYNGDDSVDAADYVVWRKTNINGAQGFQDWRANFGNTGSGSAPPETTFRTGSVVFDTSAGAGSGSAVPEPSAAWLALVGLAGVLTFGRHWARNSHPLACVTAAHNSTTQGQNAGGGRNMSRPFGLGLIVAAGLVAALMCAQPALAVPQGALLVNFDMEDPGPPEVKAFAFDELGAVVPGAIPGWIFTGPGTEDFGHPERLGDSGTEGGGNPGNEMLLSMNDGKAYQVASNFTIQSIPATQVYKFALDAHDIFTIDANNAGLPNSAQLTARFFYGAWESNQTLMTQVIDLTGDHVRYEFTIPHDSSLLAPTIGQTVGVEFTTTSPNRNPLVAKSWSGIDNVVMEIAPVMPGDFDGNGSLTTADYNILAGNIAEGACYDSPAGIRGCPFEADGELTGDYVVDLNDFRAFKTLFAAGAGGGSGGSTGGANVPEPSTGGLALVAAAAIAAARARVRTDRIKRNRSGWLPALMLAIVAGSIAFLANSPSHAELYVYDPFLIPTPPTNPANPAAGEYNEWTPPGGGATEPYGPHVPLTGQNPTPPFGTRPNFFTGGWEAWTVGHVVHPTSVGYINTPTMGGSARVAPIPNPAYTGPATSVCGTDSGALYSGCDGRAARFFATPYDDNANETVYISFIANFGETTDGNGMGYRAVEFYPSTSTPGSQWGETRIGELGYNEYWGYDNPAQQDPATARLGLGLGTQVIVTDSPASYNADGRNHLFVLKLEFSNQADMDSMFLYMDPASTEEPEIANAEHINTNFTLGAITTTTRYGGTVPTLANMGDIGFTGLFDELRIGSTYADVLPPGLPVPGDCDGDEDVDLDDYAIIRSNFHRDDAGGPPEGDVAKSDGRLGFDGKVDIGDFWLWKREYEESLSGSGGGGGGANVPEPAAAVLVALALFALGCSRRVRL
jgi:hypothetical protein